MSCSDDQSGAARAVACTLAVLRDLGHISQNLYEELTHPDNDLEFLRQVFERIQTVAVGTLLKQLPSEPNRKEQTDG